MLIANTSTTIASHMSPTIPETTAWYTVKCVQLEKQSISLLLELHPHTVLSFIIYYLTILFHQFSFLFKSSMKSAIDPLSHS